MAEQTPSNGPPDPWKPRDPVSLNYQPAASRQKTIGASILRIIVAFLLIVVLTGVLIFGYCALSLMHS